ncbi:cysteine dioxygenase family protein [Nocardiopsis sp. N85]|uniref:cysteine dioxygenase n=1 Tax=Nocardiopsis sp. N85 TaxID=3029400 RepID=UPI00237F893E|nr:cysteine dioxygenase family protein [Nocardiopsis sp. N85]MDE3724094.1 cysteine dioxygenase family protein [Nocardiopsis sp. N85]
MNVLDRFTTHFSPLTSPGPEALAAAWDAVAPTVPEILPLAGPPGVYPYGRKVIFASDDVEIIVMNWAARRMCAPHDHGASFGWVNILAGEVEHTLYTLDQNDFPVSYLKRREKSGSRYFAARGMVHSMGNSSDDLTLTVHVYAPPIHGMKVYDLEKCAACVVSDDCGAWWPEDQRQILREIRFRSPEPAGS